MAAMTAGSDARTHTAVTRSWQGWGMSVIGPGHLRMGMPNQDSLLVRRFAWGEIVVVADGLGSRPLSHLGAQAACQAVAKAAQHYQHRPQAGLEAMLRFLHEWWLWLIAPNSPSDCATTCLFAMRADGVVTLAQIGDGMVVACPRGGQAPVVLVADKSEGFANITASLTQTHRIADWRAARLAEDSVDAVVLCTDGVADDLALGMELDFARGVVASHRNLASSRRRREVRRWLEHWPVPGHSDDKTLACLHSSGDGV